MKQRMNAMSKRIKMVDTTLRDGSHAVSHSFTVEQARAIAEGLDEAGAYYIELSHGDGIGGSSINYGRSATDEMELLREAGKVVKNARLGVLLLPGIGTIEDLEVAIDAGANAVRVATHCTEADISIQHLEYAKKRGLFTAGFLMMSHMVEPKVLLEQSKIFEGCGVDYINIADSAGHMTPDEVRRKISFLAEGLDTPVGYHAHNNLGLAIGNSLAAIESGAAYIDITCRGLGAGAGNAQGEVLVSVMNMLGYESGVDPYMLQDLAENVVAPVMQRPQIVDTASLMLGYAGVYSSFLLHTYRAAEKFGLNPRDVLVELGRRKMVGGQEDMIIDVAFALSRKNK